MSDMHKEDTSARSPKEGEVRQQETQDPDSGLLVEDLQHVQEAIEQHKIDLTGVPEALRCEAQQLRDELSQMELFSRLGELKDQLCQASESKSLLPPMRDEGDSDAQDECQEASGQVPAALVCEAEDTELDIQLQQLFQAVEEAKQSKMDLETEKMRLQKEMLELQLLLNADDQAGVSDKLDDEHGPSEDDDSPRIPAVKEFQLVELCMNDSSEQAGVSEHS